MNLPSTEDPLLKNLSILIQTQLNSKKIELNNQITKTSLELNESKLVHQRTVYRKKSHNSLN